jgi:hypothetical protein
MLELKRTKDKLILSISFDVDKEDAADLIKDLQDFIDEPDELDTTGFTKEMLESYEQNQSKLKLEKQMKRAFVDILDTEYLETKFAKTYQLDAINREVEITQKKLNELKNK